MIYRLGNRSEVEEGMKEAARVQAALMIGGPDHDPRLLYAGWIGSEVKVHVNTEGWALPKEPCWDDPPLYDMLPELERQRLFAVYAAAFWEAREEVLSNRMYTEIERRAAALRCGTCDLPFDSQSHQGPDVDAHDFVCPHDQTVGEPSACIMNHEDLVVEQRTQTV